VASSTGTGAKYSTTTEYAFNGDALISTTDQQFASSVATGSPQTLYSHPDQLGSTNVVTNASGTVVQTLDFYPYGATRISSSVGGADSARKYIGQFADISGSIICKRATKTHSEGSLSHRTPHSSRSEVQLKNGFPGKISKHFCPTRKCYYRRVEPEDRTHQGSAG
jgi:hypothetical protein